MTPVKRIIVIASVVAVVGAAGLVARTLTMAGVFDAVKPLPRACDTLAGVTGAEDIAIDRVGRHVFLSASDRRAMGTSKADGIYVLSLDHPQEAAMRLAGTPREFHPHGISLFRAADGSLTLMAVNHVTPARHAIDIFEVKDANGAPSLNEIGAIESDKLNHPNDVVAVSKEQFYVTNDHGSTTALGMQLENYLLLPRANVLYYDGSVFREAADGLVFANGVNVSNDGRHIYVAESTARRIQTYAREPYGGKLTPQSTFGFPSGPDNIDVDAAGDLWIAGHPKMFALVAYASDPSTPSPTEIFKVPTKDGVPQAAEPVYVDAGAELGAGSVGAVDGKNLFIGSIFDAKVLRCRLP